MLASVRVVQRVQVEARASLVQLSCPLVNNVGGGEWEGLLGQEVFHCRLTSQIEQV